MAFLELRNNCPMGPKWGIPNGNHMNVDVAEVNGSPPQCFLHKKKPGYEASNAITEPEAPEPEGQLVTAQQFQTMFVPSTVY